MEEGPRLGRENRSQPAGQQRVDQTHFQPSETAPRAGTVHRRSPWLVGSRPCRERPARVECGASRASTAVSAESVRLVCVAGAANIRSCLCLGLVGRLLSSRAASATRPQPARAAQRKHDRRRAPRTCIHANMQSAEEISLQLAPLVGNPKTGRLRRRSSNHSLRRD